MRGMGNAKKRKAAGTYPEKTFTPKVMLANKEDITTAYIQRMNKLGYVMLMICIPDEEAHPGQSTNPSIYGNIADHAQQVAIFRDVADRIENSEEMPAQEKLGGVN
jgi:hypothetical protein